MRNLALSVVICRFKLLIDFIEDKLITAMTKQVKETKVDIVIGNDKGEKHMKCTSYMPTVFAACFALVLIILVFMAFSLLMTVQPAYKKVIEVDSSDKIEQALSNAVNDVKSRDFVVVNMTLKRHPLSKTFSIEVGGRPRGDILAFQP